MRSDGYVHVALTQKRYKRIVARARALAEHASPLQVMRYLGDLKKGTATHCGSALFEVLTIGAFDAEHTCTACSTISAADNEAEAKRESMEGARDRPSFMSPMRLRRRLLNYCSHPRLAAARISTDHSPSVPVDRGACRSCCGRTISSS